MISVEQFQRMLEDSQRDLRATDDVSFLKKRKRVKALGAVGSGSVFQKYEKTSSTVWFKTRSSGEHAATRGKIWTQRVKLLDARPYLKEGRTFLAAARLATTDGNIKVHCDCPAYKYWGFQYIDTTRGAALRREGRYPAVRNPGLRGTVCKHLHQVLQVLPFNAPKIASEMATRRDRWIGRPVREGSHGPLENALLAQALAHGIISLAEALDPRLLERAGEFEFTSTQVRLPADPAQTLLQMAAEIPDSDLASHGRETHPHITVKYGLHTDDVAEVERVVAGFGPVQVTLGETSLFQSDEYDVLKVEVESPDLHRLNALLKDRLEHTDTFPQYVPHATVAYLKPGRGKAYMGDRRLAGTTFTVPAIEFSNRAGESLPVFLLGEAPLVESSVSEGLINVPNAIMKKVMPYVTGVFLTYYDYLAEEERRIGLDVPRSMDKVPRQWFHKWNGIPANNHNVMLSIKYSDFAGSRYQNMNLFFKAAGEVPLKVFVGVDPGTQGWEARFNLRSDGVATLDYNIAKTVLGRGLMRLTSSLMQKELARIESTVEHELTHFIQHLLLAAKDPKQITAHPEYHSTKTNNPQGYWASPIEYDPQIKSTVATFLLYLKAINNHVSVTDIRKDFNLDKNFPADRARKKLERRFFEFFFAVADDLHFPYQAAPGIGAIRMSPFFTTLYNTDRPRWKKAIAKALEYLRQKGFDTRRLTAEGTDPLAEATVKLPTAMMERAYDFFAEHLLHAALKATSAEGMRREITDVAKRFKVSFAESGPPERLRLPWNPAGLPGDYVRLAGSPPPLTLLMDYKNRLGSMTRAGFGVYKGDTTIAVNALAYHATRRGWERAGVGVLEQDLRDLRGDLEHEMTHYVQHTCFASVDPAQISKTSAYGRFGTGYLVSPMEFEAKIKSEARIFERLLRWFIAQASPLDVSMATGLTIPSTIARDGDRRWVKGYMGEIKRATFAAFVGAAPAPPPLEGSEFFLALRSADPSRWKIAVRKVAGYLGDIKVPVL
jgi:2'-5' RNA ligase